MNSGLLLLVLLFCSSCRFVFFSKTSNFIYDQIGAIKDYSSVIKLQEKIFVDYGIHTYIITTTEDVSDLNNFLKNKIEESHWQSNADKGQRDIYCFRIKK